MFQLKNVYTTAALEISITTDAATAQKLNILREIKFPLGSLLSKRNRDELDPENQFKLLEGYINTKPEKFKEDLLTLYHQSQNTIIETMVENKTLTPMPHSAVYDIMDMFDLNDIESFLKNTDLLKKPTYLVEVFDIQSEKDGLMTRDQTYTVQDYYELSAVVLLMKAILPVLGYYTALNDATIGNNNKEYVIYDLYRSHKALDHPAVHKLKSFINRVMHQPKSDGDDMSTIVIDKGIPSIELPDLILSQILVHKIAPAVLITDKEDEHIIKKSYRFFVNKLGARSSFNHRISEKHASTGPDEQSSDSLVEAYRIIANQSTGTIEEINWVTSDIEKVIKFSQLPCNIDDVMTIRNVINNSKFIHNVSDEQTKILAYIFKKVIMPQAIDHLNKESILNLFAIGFSILWELDCKELACVLVSIPLSVDSNSMTINTDYSRNYRVDNNIKDELEQLYKHQRVINSTTFVNMAVEAASKVASGMFKYQWVPIIPDKYINQVDGLAKNAILASDIKQKLCEAIVKMEKNHATYRLSAKNDPRKWRG